jgi:hypothetical protein
MKLSPKKRAELKAQNRDALKLARKLNLLHRDDHTLPQNLCQRVVADEQHIADVATKRFKRAVGKGRNVYLLTVCHPDWICPAGSLSPDLVIEVRDWMSRRARRLATFCQQRMLGFVDIAWNDRSGVDESSFWCVHAHVVIRLKLPEAYDAERMIKEAFACHASKSEVQKPVHVARLATEEDVARASAYCAKAMQLQLNRGRWSYEDKRGRRGSRKVSLPTARQLEVGKLISLVGPQKLWILSGLRRKGDHIDLHQRRCKGRPLDRHRRNRSSVRPTSSR